MPLLKQSLIIAQTGFSQPEYYRHSLQAGFDHHLVKPIDITAVEN